jgi:hypothetical protein
MKTLIPKIKKKKYSSNIFMERALPLKGTISVKEGDTVDPVTRLGMTKISTGISYVPVNFKLSKGKFESGYFYYGETIGRTGFNKVVGPFDGYISKSQQGYILTQEPKEHWLLSGMWGSVEKLIGDSSVLIKTQAMDFDLAVCSSKFVNGELVVFPNPTDVLQLQYLQNFSKDVFGKIIYLGGFATFESIEKAVELGVSGLLAGSAEKQAFDYAKEKGICLGLFSGFGRLETPEIIYDFIKEVSGRFVFMMGERNLFRIPVPPMESGEVSNNNVLVEPVVGMLAQVFQKPYYTHVGQITDVQNDVIYVKLNGAEQPVQIKLPNIVAVE